MSLNVAGPLPNICYFCVSMPNVTRVIFLKDQLRDDIAKFWFDEKARMYVVVFTNGDGKRLYYGQDSVDVLDSVRNLEPPFRVTRVNDGIVFHKILGVRVFSGKKHKAYRVIYENGSAKNYPFDYLSVEEHIDDFRSLNVLEYLREVAQYSRIPIDEEKSISLADKYAKASFIAKKSLMEAFLNPETYSTDSSPIKDPIFPFGCNSSQSKAVRNALSSQLSIIQGPPGTGKTQTILNIMANLVISGKTVQIVSNNNSAVENVAEKLSSIGLDFILAQLGKSANKEAFIKTQNGIYPDFTTWLGMDDIPDLSEVRKVSAQLQSLYEKQEREALLSNQECEVRQQMKLMGISDDNVSCGDPSAIFSLLLRCKNDLEKKARFSLTTRFALWRKGLSRKEDVIGSLETDYYRSLLWDIQHERSGLKTDLTDLKREADKLQKMSLAIFKDYLRKRYNNDKRQIFQLDDIYLKTHDFLKEYPVVLSTTFSATTNINPEYTFDYLIMDEASQVDVAAGALALNCAKRAVIVGDLKQLPNVVDANLQETSDAVFAKYGISEYYRFKSNSFLAAVCNLLPNAPSTLLREHYRCHPQIIGFCNQQFYNGELIPMKTVDEYEFPAIRHITTVKGNHARGTHNIRQVATVVEEILPAVTELYGDIGVIAPYNDQVNLLNTALQNSEYNSVSAATVHKFQGREKDVIILSTVDNQIGEFADDPHLLNVAVSRAKEQFILLTSSEEQPDSNIRDLIHYIEYWSGESEESHIRSVFDLLYSDYTNERLAFLRKHKRVSQYDSENIMYGFLEDLFEKHGMTHYGILLQYPLNRLIRSKGTLSEEEWSFASRSWSHVDFLIYNKISHMALLAIEVDGCQFHNKTVSQYGRDRIKDRTLSSIGLPLLRLSTAGHDEEGKILRALMNS